MSNMKKQLLIVLSALCCAAGFGADQPSQGVSVKGTNGYVWSTNANRFFLHPTNGMIAGSFDGSTPTLTASDGGIIAGRFNSSVSCSVTSQRGGISGVDFATATNASAIAYAGVAQAVFDSSTNCSVQAYYGAWAGALGTQAKNVTVLAQSGAVAVGTVSGLDGGRIFAGNGSYAGGLVSSGTNKRLLANYGLGYMYAPSRNNIELTLNGSIILALNPPSDSTNTFSGLVGILDAGNAFTGMSTNGFTSDNAVFTEMPTNTPAVGQVITATSTSGHTKWGLNGNATNYIYLTHPHQVDGTGATLGSTTTALDFGHATFSHSADQAANYVQYRFEGPPDLNASYPLYARLKFRLNAGDTGTHRYVLSCSSVANSAAAAGSVGTAINLDFAGDASGASGDVESVGWTALTGWAAALTPGQLWVIQLARDGDAAEDASTQTSTEVGLVLSYVSAP